MIYLYRDGGARMIGRRIKEQRQKVKWTQKELAKKVNVSPQVISNWEREYTTPDSTHIALLSKAMQVSSDYLLGHTDDPSFKTGATDDSNINIAFYDGLKGFEELDPEQQQVIMDTVEDMVARFKKRKQERQNKKNT
ncbi:DNA-binding helix-turn-helix protein [Aneurinibacillus migulanus]|nr:DNA-binding helix-turn-helix protein [Aneurinibacillus migulanus]